MIDMGGLSRYPAAMSIQFECVSCGKPIEIDEQWALKLVECPYCHDQITAPGISTLRSEAVRPEAPDIAVPMAASPNMAAGVAVKPRSGILGVIALVLAIVALVTCVVTMVGFVGFANEHVDMAKYEEAGAEGVKQLQSELNAAVMKEAEAGNLSILLISMGFLLGMLVWLAGVVCGVLALALNYGRRPAAVGLVICGGLLAVPCLGLLM